MGSRQDSLSLAQNNDLKTLCPRIIVSLEAENANKSNVSLAWLNSARLALVDAYHRPLSCVQSLPRSLCFNRCLTAFDLRFL
jgi:hypothetical protein